MVTEDLSSGRIYIVVTEGIYYISITEVMYIGYRGPI